MNNTSKKPNIIYIVSDQHRGQAMSHAGDPNVQTPFMDQLAAEGVSFDRAYANCPICVPSRGTMFTGRHAHANGVVSNFSTLYPAMPTVAKELTSAGYHTCYMGKWHLCDHGASDGTQHMHPDGKPLNGAHYIPPRYRGGFQDWFEGTAHDHFRSYYFQGNERTPHILEKYETDGFTDLAIDYMANYNKDNPLFMVLSVSPPHGPFEAPERNRRLDHRTLKVRPNFSDVTAGEKADYAKVLGHMPRSWREYLEIYYAMIENLDENIGRLLTTIKEDPRWQNTIVVYLSDHGEFGGSHGRMYRKSHPHEEGVNIPMIWHWPEHIRPSQDQQPLFSLIDLMPTTLGLAGAAVPDYCQGTDFSGHLQGTTTVEQDHVLLEMGTVPRFSEDYMDWRAIVTREWKYAVYEDGAELLFNLIDDPYEMQNLADDPSQNQQKLKLRQRMCEECLATGDVVFPMLLDELKRSS